MKKRNIFLWDLILTPSKNTTMNVSERKVGVKKVRKLEKKKSGSKMILHEKKPLIIVSINVHWHFLFLLAKQTVTKKTSARLQLDLWENWDVWLQRIFSQKLSFILKTTVPKYFQKEIRQKNYFLTKKVRGWILQKKSL